MPLLKWKLDKPSLYQIDPHNIPRAIVTNVIGQNPQAHDLPDKIPHFTSPISLHNFENHFLQVKYHDVWMSTEPEALTSEWSPYLNSNHGENDEIIYIITDFVC